MLKIDMHSHILPKTWPDLNEKFNTTGFPTIHHKTDKAEIHKDGRFFRAVTKNSWDALDRIEEYKQHNVQTQVISTVPVMFSYWANPEYALYLACYLNDHVAKLCAAYPKNYIGLGTLPMQSPEIAVKEMERCIKDINLRGIQIGSHINNWNLNDEALFPIYEAAESLGCAIMVHPWDMMGKTDMPKYWLPWLVGMPAEQSRAICSMIFGGIFEKFPKLKVLFAHGGGAFPMTIGRIEHGFKMRPDIVAVDNTTNPREYFGKYYIDSVVHDTKALSYLLDVVGYESIALGTDYPFPLGEQVPGKDIDSLNLENSIKERLYHGTTLEWLGLDIKDFIT